MSTGSNCRPLSGSHNSGRPIVSKNSTTGLYPPLPAASNFEQNQPSTNYTTTFQTQLSSDQQRSSSPDGYTKIVVNELKSIIEKSSGLQKADESFIEKKVFEIRAKRRLTNDNLNEHRKLLSDDLKNCSDDVLKQALAYGDDCSKFETILKEKLNKNNSPNKSLFINTPSLEDLKRALKVVPSSNLFRAVLNIDDNEINRADRMFYGEAHRLVKNLTDYTFDNAHDQVQAIRLTHYQSNNEQELRDLIQRYRTFDDAYSYLRRLAKNQASHTSDSSRFPSTMSDSSNYRGEKSVIKDASDRTSSNTNNSNLSTSNALINSSGHGRTGSANTTKAKETSC